MNAVKVSDTARDILSRSTFGADFVKLPHGQLERSAYVEVDKVLKALGGKWNRSAGAHKFSADPRAQLEKVLGGEKIEDKKKALQAFYTPDALADRLVKYANLEFGNYVLEPSAGEGAIVKAIRRVAGGGVCHVTAVEVDDTKASALVHAGVNTLFREDFLSFKSSETYDRVIMNPPFHGGADVRHVMHAWNLVRPTGRLVAIVSPAFRFRTSAPFVMFRQMHERYGVHEENVEAGAFRESGTDVRTVIVVWERS